MKCELTGEAIRSAIKIAETLDEEESVRLRAVELLGKVNDKVERSSYSGIEIDIMNARACLGKLASGKTEIRSIRKAAAKELGIDGVFM